MKLLIAFLSVSFCMFLLVFVAACAGGGNGDRDTPIDQPTDDFTQDDTVSPDIPDLDAIDTHPDPVSDLEVIPDGMEVRPDSTDGAEDGACLVGLTGDPCSSVSQCACVPSSARECLTSLSGYISFPGGYCSARCTSPADCGTGANCAEITTGTRYCLKVCSSASQCRMAERYTCTTIPRSSDTRTYCLPDTPDPDGG